MSSDQTLRTAMMLEAIDVAAAMVEGVETVLKRYSASPFATIMAPALLAATRDLAEEMASRLLGQQSRLLDRKAEPQSAEERTL